MHYIIKTIFILMKNFPVPLKGTETARLPEITLVYAIEKDRWHLSTVLEGARNELRNTRERSERLTVAARGTSEQADRDRSFAEQLIGYARGIRQEWCRVAALKTPAPYEQEALEILESFLQIADTVGKLFEIKEATTSQAAGAEAGNPVSKRIAQALEGPHPEGPARRPAF